MHIFSHYCKRLLFPLFLLLTWLLITCLPAAGLAKRNNIPDDLQQWIPWVLYEQEEKICSLETTKGMERYCTWPSSLELDVREDGADFTQKWLIETRSLVSLPGHSPLWPQKVTVNGKDVLVTTHQGGPAVWLDAGEHLVTGVFSWKKLPEYLSVPPETGLVHLTLLGKKVDNLRLDTGGKLWFRYQEKSEQTSEESLTIQVFRMITDGVPLTQQLRIQIIVSGSPRQITLGLGSDEAFSPLQIISPLPVRLDARGRLQLQVRPGQWQIQLTLRNTLGLSQKHSAWGSLTAPGPKRKYGSLLLIQNCGSLRLRGLRRWILPAPLFLTIGKASLPISSKRMTRCSSLKKIAEILSLPLIVFS